MMEPSWSFVKTVENLPEYGSGTGKLPMFSAGGDRRLCHRWRDHHDISAAHQLVGKYLHIASKIADGYADFDIPLEELISEGYVGLMRAVCRFDPGWGVRFTTYAIWHTRTSIHDYIVRTMGMTLAQMAMFCGVRREHGDLQEFDDATLRSVHQQNCEPDEIT